MIPNRPEFNFGWRKTFNVGDAQCSVHANELDGLSARTTARELERPCIATTHGGHWRAGSVSRIETPPTAAGNVAGAGRPQ
jgi:hypothetical protein